MRLLRPSLASAFFLFGIVSAFALESKPAPDRVTGPVVASVRVPTNLVHPMATAQADAGRLAASQVFHRMVLMLKGSDAQKADLTQLMQDQQNPKSASYHKWLTPAEFGARFGPSTNDIGAVTGWLKAQGFQVEAPANGRRFVLFTGSSQQVEAAFQTEMHRYAVNGKTYMANSKPASIPAALAPVVRGVASMNSFGKAKPQYVAVKKPQALVGGFIGLAPKDLSTIYNADPLKSAAVLGDGQSIAVIERSNIDPSDFSDFRTIFGLPAGTLNVIVNGDDPGLLAGDESEAIIDATWAGAIAPNATINFIVSASGDFNDGIDLSSIYAVDYLVSPITSTSYGDCETFNDSFGGGALYLSIYEQGAAEGISHFVSSGDNGADACERVFANAGFGVNGLGSTPYNVSVGGTELIDPNPLTYFPAPSGNATGYIPERTMNDYPEDGVNFAGTGGVSIDFLKPYWQSGPGVPDDSARDVPDVSLVAGFDQSYLVCEKDIGADCSKKFVAFFAGTSISTPMWAGIQALINQKNAVVGGAGNPNPTYYRLAAATNSPFHDITVGDTKTPDANGTLVGYAATAGYDLATGLGSVDINALVNAWSAPTGTGAGAVALTTSAAHITHGDSLTADVMVTTNGTTVPTGDVALLAGPQGAIQLALDGTGAASYAFGGTTPTGNELPGGSYNLTARYAGDANFASAVSNAVALTVDAEPSTTVESSGAGTVAYGTVVTVSALTFGNNSNTGIAAGGAYTFTDGGTTLGTAKAPQIGESFGPFVPVQANLSLGGAKALPVGAHSIVASFPGDASFLTSSSTPVSVTVQQGHALVSLLVDHTSPALNTPVNFTANVQSFEGFLVPVTGSITFFDGSSAIGTVTLPTTYDDFSELAVTLPYTFTTAGVHSVIAQYSGDGNVRRNISGIVNVTVGGLASTTTTVGANTFSLAGVSTTVTAVVVGDSAGTVPTGTVTFTDARANSGAGTVLGTAPLGTNGVATANFTTIAAGLHDVTASYSGDANYSGSISTAAFIRTGDFTITPAASTASVVAGQTSAGVSLAYAGQYLFTTYATITPNVVFACSGLPNGAVCNFSTNPIVPTATSTGGGAGATTLTITAAGPTLTKASAERPARGALIAVAGLFLLGLPFALRRRRLLPGLLCLVLMVGSGLVSGCSGSSGSSTPTSTGYTPTGGTPAGTSAVTVTATVNGGTTYGTLSHTVTVNLTVTSATGQ